MNSLYGGTKEEMQRLLKDAQKLSGVKYDISNFSDIINAIHVIQDNMGITGTTMKEAEHTITGSLNMVKAAWKNVLTDFVNGGDRLDKSIENLVYAAKSFMANIMPAIRKAMSGLGQMVQEIAPIIAAELPGLVNELLPPLIGAAASLVAGLIKALPSIVGALIKQLPTIAAQIGDAFMQAFGVKIPLLESFGEMVQKNSDILLKAVPAILGIVGVMKIFGKIKSIKGSLGKDNDNPVSPLTNIFESIAKMKVATVAKAVVNIGIVVAGMTAIAAGLMALAPYLSKLTDTGSIIKLVGVIGAVGVVGGAMAELSGVVGKIKVSTVAKGLANIAIIIGGLAGLYVVLGATSLLNFDSAKVTQLVNIIAITGIVGTAMAGLAGLAGMIPVAQVAKGLANIAIVLGGMSALYVVMGALTFLDFDTGKITQIITIIGLTGAIGSALTVLAGAIGLIPIPAVLSGLANIALALGGFTGIVSAFSLLSKIPGFEEFINRGGEVLSQLFGVIGNIAGSLIGGIGEGVSAALPAIGENLAAFATAIQPLFTMVQGVDLGSLGQFFTSIGEFMLQMTGDKIASFFTGGVNFAEKGAELSQFATSLAPFFQTVSTIPENGFSNAKLLFESLSQMGDLPKSGGLKQLFTGTIDMETLNQLPEFGAKMSEFYASISGITDFSKATQLFEALQGMSDAFPKDGGIWQKLAGSTDIVGTGEQLRQFGQATSEFFAMASSVNAGNVSGLFEALKKAGEIAQTDMSGLADVGLQLSQFFTQAQGFFTGAVEAVPQLEAVNQVALALQAFFMTVSTIVGTSLATIGTGLQTITASTQTTAAGFQAMGGAMLTATATGSAGFTALTATARVSAQAILTAIRQLAEGMANSIKQAVTAFTTAISQGMQLAVTTVKNACTAIKTALSGIDLKTAGENVINGFLNGMKARERNLMSYVDNLVRSIKTKVNKGMEIGSPSKYMYRVGRFTIEGLVNGIKDHMPKVKTTAERIVEPFKSQPIVNVQPAAVNVQPTPVNVAPAAVNVQPTAVNVAPTSIDTAPMAVQPTAVNVQPTAVQPTVNVAPTQAAPINVTPTPISVQPAAVNVAPTSVSVAPTPISVAPAAVSVAPTPLTVQPAQPINNSQSVVNNYANAVDNTRAKVINNAVDNTKSTVVNNYVPQYMPKKVDTTPTVNVYTPESDPAVSNTTTNTRSENNYYSPTFNLTITGTKSDYELEHKVKRWLREGLNSMIESETRIAGQGAY